jgi:hypothetical protein
MTTRNMEKTFNKIGKNLAALLVGGASLLGAENRVDAQVKFRVEKTRDDVQYETRIFQPYETIEFFVYADNTNEINPTSGVQCGLETKEGKVYSALAPNPHYEGGYYDSIGATNDFFKNFTMSTTNSVTTNGIVRKIQSTGNNLSNGPSQTRGLIGVFHAEFPIEGTYKIRIKDTKAWDTNGNLQPSVGSEVTVKIMNRDDYISAMTNAPVIIQDKEPDGSLRVHVPQNKRRFGLESTQDLNYWEPNCENPLSNFWTKRGTYGPFERSYSVSDSEQPNLSIRAKSLD